MNFVTLGHFFTSSRASPVVIRRQLLSPKPSASAIVTFLLPHHEGAPLTEELLDAPPELELELEPDEPQAATVIAAPATMAATRSRLRSTFALIGVFTVSLRYLFGSGAS